MASVLICLAINQKFNFSKYIYESMVKHLDTGNKFLMYPRFVQVFLDKQVDGMSKHNAIYVIPSHAKKVFGNMKRVGKDFFRKETPLFSTINNSSKGDFKFKKESQEIGEEKEFNNSWLKRLYKVGLSDRVESYAEEQSMGVLDDEEVVVEIAVAVKEVDVAQDQVTLKTSKPKIRGIVVRDHKELSESTTIPTSVADSTRPKAKSIIMQEPSETPTTTTIPIPLKIQNKGKGIMVEELLKMKKKDQISFDEQEARRLQAELDQEQRLAEKEA
nr:hypothetical protein [Tanacetum cinerariifolium]